MKNLSRREPHIVVVLNLIINDKDLYKKEIRIDIENLNKDGLLDKMEKEKEGIQEKINIQLADDEQVFVRFVNIEVKESFLNPDLKVGEVIIPRFSDIDGVKRSIN